MYKDYILRSLNVWQFCSTHLYLQNQKYIPAVLAVGTFRSCDNKQFVKYKKDVHQVVWQHEFANHDKIPFFSLSPTILLRELIIVIRPVSYKKQELLTFRKHLGLSPVFLWFSCRLSFDFSLLWVFCFVFVICPADILSGLSIIDCPFGFL